MKTKTKSLLVALCTTALCATPVFARTLKPMHTAQPEMNQALVQLEEAKHSKHPIVHLEKAKDDLQDAKHNKHGERVEAIKQVNEAIAAAHKHNHKAMETHIAAAIRDIREGKHAARK
ncbi:MAG: hypothetical protein WCK55_15960 [Verrucomicrobiota bacterium]